MRGTADIILAYSLLLPGFSPGPYAHRPVGIIGQPHRFTGNWTMDIMDTMDFMDSGSYRRHSRISNHALRNHTEGRISGIFGLILLTSGCSPWILDIPCWILVILPPCRSF